MCATVGFSDVQSANIVGYTTIAQGVAAGQFVTLAVQFENVATANASICINDLVKCNNPIGRTSLDARADQIHVWRDEGGWDMYYYHSTLLGFVKDGEDQITKETVRNGTTVFFLRSSKGVLGDYLTLSGGVAVSTTSVVTPLSQGQFVFVSNPWPVEMKIDDAKNLIFTQDDKPAVIGRTSLDARADQIHVWKDEGGWDMYYYHSTLLGFVKDGESEITKEKIDVGKGFFFLRSSKGAVSGDKLVFTKPSGL